MNSAVSYLFLLQVFFFYFVLKLPFFCLVRGVYFFLVMPDFTKFIFITQVMETLRQEQH